MRLLRCKKTLLLHLLLLIVLLSSQSISDNLDIIPQPQKILKHTGGFTITKQTCYHSDTSLANNAITYLQNHLKQSSRYQLKQNPSKAQLYFRYSPKTVKKKESYLLQITSSHIIIEARDSGGFFYGIVTLLQLMPPEIWAPRSKRKNWPLPACTIKDAPRFSWRGMMLDVSRNFFSVTYIKTFIDRMAQYKLNRFHWHLTDDEGWRIKIKRYPLLTDVGAKRGPGTKLPFSTFPAMKGPKKHVQSGYYTQNEIKEIVHYAKVRNIEIIPEIDLPGHAKAAVTSYPELLLDPNDSSSFRSVQKVANNTINPGRESTYIFLDNIIKEMAALFPFGYIHLGGDEVPKGAWRDSPAVKRLMQTKNLKNKKAVENYFFTRMDKILKKYGRKMGGWQEVVKGKPHIRKNTLIIAWKNPKAGVKAIKKGYHTVMAPVQYLYFDQQYVRNKKEPGHTWSTPVSLKKAYSFNPPDNAHGIQACLWSETLLNKSIADYLAWPRILALSETAWSTKKSWKEFKNRVKIFAFPRLEAQKIRYRK